MRRFFLSITVASLSWALNQSALAEPATAPACTAAAAPTGELAPWTSPMSLDAGGDLAKATVLEVGKAVNVGLRRTSEVNYALRPDRAAAPESYGGLVSVDVVEPATYRVALGSAAWIDMIKQGQAVASTAHAHGPDCSGVRKMVDFPLTPGRYTLQLSGNGEDKIRVLVARLP